MKKTIFILGILLFSYCLHAAEITDDFTEKYNALVPPENSSVHGDYLFEQIALGSRYTIMMLERINETNKEAGDRTDQLIEKLDILIEQNEMIIKLLKKEVPNKQP